MTRRELTILLLGTVVLLSLFLVGSAFAATQTLRVTETELVKLQVEGEDADGDAVTYTYSLPLNEKGEWQTKYGDAGEYNLKVTASDGISETEQYITLIVEKKNRPPQLKQRKLIVREGDEINLKEIVSDPDGDALLFSFSKPFTSEGIWKTGGNDAGIYKIQFSADDKVEGRNAPTLMEMEIEVLGVNQLPTIWKTFSDSADAVHSEEDKTNYFFAEVTDEDHDRLSYRWSLDGLGIGEEANISYYFNYTSAGKHDLRLSVSDGAQNITKQWEIVIAEKNRRPEIDHVPIIVNEGEKVKIDLPLNDIDGDSVTYGYEFPLTERGEWQTGFTDAGQYRFKITASDGRANNSGLIDVTVLDVDQKPVLVLPEEVVLFEGQDWNLTVAVSDPDNDDVFLSGENLLEGMTLEDGVLAWNPGYDTIQRRGGVWSDFLNTLRLEQYFLKERRDVITINACGKKECTTAPISVRLRNVNRAPILENVSNITITETEALSLAVSAVDPDGDIVHYYYTEPLPRRTAAWQTKKGDRGKYITYVTATDGENQMTVPIELMIKKKNTLPTLIIEDEVTVREGKEFTLQVSGKDEDNDELQIRLRNPPSAASFGDGRFVWQPGYNSVVNKTDSWWNSLLSRVPYVATKLSSDKAATMLEFSISDGESEVVHPVKVNVVNTNREPQIIDYLPKKEITVPVGEPVLFQVTGKDADADRLTYTWSFNLHEPRIEGTNTIERTFIAPGEKEVTVEVSDGQTRARVEWKVNVVEREEIVPEKKQEPFTVQVYELEFKR